MPSQERVWASNLSTRKDHYGMGRWGTYQYILSTTSTWKRDPSFTSRLNFIMTDLCSTITTLVGFSWNKHFIFRVRFLQTWNRKPDLPTLLTAFIHAPLPKRTQHKIIFCVKSVHASNALLSRANSTQVSSFLPPRVRCLKQTFFKHSKKSIIKVGLNQLFFLNISPLPSPGKKI